jgi:hypothetical protein
MREHMIGMMRDDFAPLRKFSKAYDQDEQVQIDIDYILAKTRQRINQVKEYSSRAC